MLLVINNPYRVIGITSNASEKEIIKQKTKIKRFAEIGRQADSDFDFSFFEKINKSPESIDKAFSDIESQDGKILHSLFWFLNLNPIDNTAIQYLINGEYGKAVSIYEQVTQNKSITDKNYSAFNNLGTLCFLNKEQASLIRGVKLKLSIIDSQLFSQFIEGVVGSATSVDLKKQRVTFVEQIISELEGMGYSQSDLIDFFKKADHPTYQTLMQKGAGEIIYKIEKAIESTRKQRTHDARGAHQFGLNLYRDCKYQKLSLTLLRSMLGEKSIEYKAISNDVAEEILQCAIDYFNHWHDTGSSGFYRKSIHLLENAAELCLSSRVQERIDKNIDNIRQQEQQVIIKKEIEVLTNEFEKITTKSKTGRATLADVEELVSVSYLQLMLMKMKVGTSNDDFLTFSDVVCSIALGIMIDVVNREQEQRSGNLKSSVSEAIKIIALLDKLTLTGEQRNRLSKNLQALQGLQNAIQSSSNEESDGMPGIIIFWVIIIIIAIALVIN